ncbi:MAG TPA: hypothetical protein VKB19_01030 [Pedobacter sp.]|nr:hypothetical protein [Pedobacter sp.]
MNTSSDFICQSFLENTSLCILEIPVDIEVSNDRVRSNQWLIVNKADLSVRMMNLKSRDASSWVQERYFDLGYLKYDSTSGIFIEVQNHGLHHLVNANVSDVPAQYLSAVAGYLSNLAKSTAA